MNQIKLCKPMAAVELPVVGLHFGTPEEQALDSLEVNSIAKILDWNVTSLCNRTFHHTAVKS
jgi:hypothetical protein